ncbi:RHS repeat-associated core domain-containing protein, partial [Aliidiomarina sanyensis]
MWSHSEFVFGLRLGEMRGYTGHTMVNDLNLIHMGGRTYNPVLGRFMQADPFIQAGANLQNYNRYSYVLNNPMSYTDPSGYLFNRLNKALGDFAPFVAIVIMAMPFGQSLGGAMLKGFLSGGVATGSLRGAMVGGLTIGIGFEFQGLRGTSAVLARGGLGGVMNVVQGGKFGHGVLSSSAGGVTNS